MWLCLGVSLNKFVVLCPSCSRAAFYYDGRKITIGQKIDLRNIIGAFWKEPTIPCCHVCQYAFGPNDFKENRFQIASDYVKANPNDMLPKFDYRKDSPSLVDGSEKSFDSLAESAVFAPMFTPEPAKLSPDFPQSSSGAFERAWIYFREVLKKQSP